MYTENHKQKLINNMLIIKAEIKVFFIFTFFKS